MALRIRSSGRVLCAAMHDAEPGDRYVDDQTHYQLSVELGVLVTEPMTCDPENRGRGGHAVHGEWWWREEVPSDVVVEGAT